MPGAALGDRGAQSRVRYAPPTIGAAQPCSARESFGFGAAEIDALVTSGTVIQN